MKTLLKIIFNLLLIAVLAILALWVRDRYLGNKNFSFLQNPLVQQNKKEAEWKAVELAGPAKMTYQWKYNGAAYEVSLTLYQSLYNFYKNAPKSFVYEGELPANWETDFYQMFFRKNPSDKSITELAGELKKIASQKKMSDDQLVELTLSFVQNISYDDIKAAQILSDKAGAPASYSYEVLFEKKGVCNDKSFLTVALLQELGYGTALFTYDAEKHMAVGIQCPEKYSSYESGYCYAETTSPGFRIGVIPDIDPAKRNAVTPQAFSHFEDNQVNKFDVSKLGTAQIFLKTSGKTYEGIKTSVQIAKEIDTLKQEVNSLSQNLVASQAQINAQKKEIDDAAKKMEKLKKDEAINAYNKLVPEYNKMVKVYQANISAYNADVNEYNKKVDRYNLLIKSF
ncbi:MAG: hypothetical protein NTZ97_03820 [Candidatus Moranbacteria bacterium]|nr:hypothetical protein [Candidatus Moranbacteria bacterium]